ncbi:leucyl aminopeptidase [Ureaplasma urealyticum]|uniref:Probable cytosol aminopeptidase n=3 Tax=Ureaplasma urealyticum TaxID=2130 RepID=A0AAP9ACA2_UREUR|nr:leucyl aminopeptidase [Ureaplasma urealyticum]RCT49174.1 leucyl aminopeptidase [Ureaplasma parvum]ACI60114.1 cytosol aminopeptidase family protein [Ureaplasma urealyticum serovar 10 str. ATCC 33699]EDT49749.1 cytosol aminopeptidase family protein [Ureaplasma urealyticum serovar 13 str. ATCC 33698]EDU06161.1 cytosol aminopeptidase family protein [Ureaplasma urealyticum serovar 5 str. ATCC 27817]EDU57229.1 cytosol aminopeptidase family protein [Ureaplasma urealyticum serovar 7 str. ATCC 27819
MTLNEKKEFVYELKAVKKDHNLKGFEKNTAEHVVFGEVYQKQHYLILTPDFDSNELSRSLVSFLEKSPKPVSVDLNSFLDLVPESRHASLLNVVVSALEYVEVTPFSLKSKVEPKNIHNLVVDAKYHDLIAKLQVIAQSQTITRTLQDTPANLMTPGDFEERIKELFKDLPEVKVSVLYRKDLEAKGMNAHVGVGKAAVSDKAQPRLVVVEYNNNPDTDEKYAFVGKGVCFDSGGYNVKTGSHMRWMKFDMSGSAIVSMTVRALALNKEKVNVVAVCPLVLNLLAPEGQKPDDIIKSYNGKTIELDNTDAEGRLILADALTYAVRDLKASKLFDIATLTGAMIFALGDTYSGVWATNNDIWNEVVVAADYAGELVWRLPFHNDFLKMLNSNVADIANSVTDPRGGSSRAACFLKEFTEGVPYAHFDIAITADVGHKGTGVMLRTFYRIAQNQKFN